jgi:predicted nucleic acid-binding protein
LILIDTSVWIDHLRSQSPAFESIDLSEVITHRFVIGELACGMFRQRRNVLELLAGLPEAVVATHDEVMLFIEKHRLMGTGISYIDAHLLAAASLTKDALLWTHDKHLAAAAAHLRLGLTRH